MHVHPKEAEVLTPENDADMHEHGANMHELGADMHGNRIADQISSLRSSLQEMGACHPRCRHHLNHSPPSDDSSCAHLSHIVTGQRSDVHGMKSITTQRSF